MLRLLSAFVNRLDGQDLKEGRFFRFLLEKLGVYEKI